LNWALDHAEAPAESAHFPRLAHIGELVELLGEIG
jgi:hypothetical protein